MNATNVPFEECTVTSERQKSYSLVCGDPDDPAAVTTRKVAPYSVQTARLKPLSTSDPAQKSVAIPLQISTQETSTPAQDKNDNNGGLSTSATIAIGVVIPALSLIAAIVFGVRLWNSGLHARRNNKFTEIPMNQVENPSSTAFSVPACSSNDRNDLYSLPPGFVEAPLNSQKPQSPVSMHHVEVCSNSSTPQPQSLVRDYVELPLGNRDKQTSIPGGIHELSIEHRFGPLIELPENSERNKSRNH